MWRTSFELLDTIHQAHERLKSKETDAQTAHAEARLLGAATRVLAINLEHARLTNRLREGSAELPTMELSGMAQTIPVSVGGGQLEAAAAVERTS